MIKSSLVSLVSLVVQNSFPDARDKMWLITIPKVNRTHLPHHAVQVLSLGEVGGAGRIELPLVVAGVDELQLGAEQQIPQLLVVEEA